MSTYAGLGDYVEHFRIRVVQDAFAEATAAYWLRLAAQFEWARPTPTDFAGNAAVTQLRAKWHELGEVADACRCRAAVSIVGGEMP